jgi:hypothetical protein
MRMERLMTRRYISYLPMLILQITSNLLLLCFYTTYTHFLYIIYIIAMNFESWHNIILMWDDTILSMELHRLITESNVISIENILGKLPVVSVGVTG